MISQEKIHLMEIDMSDLNFSKLSKLISTSKSLLFSKFLYCESLFVVSIDSSQFSSLAIINNNSAKTLATVDLIKSL